MNNVTLQLRAAYHFIDSASIFIILIFWFLFFFFLKQSLVYIEREIWFYIFDLFLHIIFFTDFVSIFLMHSYFFCDYIKVILKLTKFTFAFMQIHIFSHMLDFVDIMQANSQHFCKKGNKNIGYQIRDLSCRVHCNNVSREVFGGFRSANTRFRFVVLIVNDHPRSRRGCSGSRARINGIDWTIPVGAIRPRDILRHYVCRGTT